MHDDGPQLDVVAGVFALARELWRHLGELMAEEKWAVDAGFRPPCLGVLAVVGRHQPISQREISNYLGIDASDVVGVLDILESARLVERQRDPDDRRRHAVVLTAKGKQAETHFAGLRAEAERRALEHLSPAERRQFADLLTRAVSRPHAVAGPGH